MAIDFLESCFCFFASIGAWEHKSELSTINPKSLLSTDTMEAKKNDPFERQMVWPEPRTFFRPNCSVFRSGQKGSGKASKAPTVMDVIDQNHNHSDVHQCHQGQIDEHHQHPFILFIVASPDSLNFRDWLAQFCESSDRFIHPRLYSWEPIDVECGMSPANIWLTQVQLRRKPTGPVKLMKPVWLMYFDLGTMCCYSGLEVNSLEVQRYELVCR